MASGITRDDWLRALTAAGVYDETDDQSAVTISEFGEMMGLVRHVAARRLKALEDAGLATKTKKRVRIADGRQIQLPAWKLDATKKKKR